MRGACTNSAAPGHALPRHKSEHHLRSASIARRASVSQHSPRPPKPMKILPTVEEVTPAILAEEGRYEGTNNSVQGPRHPFGPRNESFDVQQSLPPQRTLKHSLPSKVGLNEGVRGSIFAIFRRKSQRIDPPNAKIRRESSVTGAVLQEMEEENEEEAAWERLMDRTENSSRPPTLVHHQVRQSTDTRRSRTVHRSVSFAGLNSQVENRKGNRGTVMEAVFQLRQAWNETTDTTPDFDEGSDEEY